MSTIDNNKKRIAILIPDLHYGGVERVAGDLSKIFCENGYEVYFFVEKLKRNKSFSYMGFVKKVHFGKGISAEKTFMQNLSNLIRQAVYLKKIKRKYKIDIAISFHAYINLINILSKDKEKIILTIHEVTSVNAAKLQYFFYNKFIFEKIYKKQVELFVFQNIVKRIYVLIWG